MLISALRIGYTIEFGGKKYEILTLSKGKFKEVFDEDSIVQIGTVLFNTNSNQIVAFVKQDTLYSEASLKPEINTRWLSPDPLANKQPFISPYAYVNNNPILMFDPDGRLPWPVWVRSFISTPTTGGGFFSGDGRGASFDGTSRVHSSFTVDPSAKVVTQPVTKSDPTIFYGVPGQLPPTADVGRPTGSNDNISFGSNSASFDFSHSGKDPITPQFLTPSLDVHANLSLTEDTKNGVLTISGAFTGDQFPSTEAFILDQSGKTKLFLGAEKEQGGITDLFGDNKKTLFNVNMQVQFNEKGNFTGVKQGDKSYSVNDWNKHVQESFGK